MNNQNLLESHGEGKKIKESLSNCLHRFWWMDRHGAFI